MRESIRNLDILPILTCVDDSPVSKETTGGTVVKDANTANAASFNFLSNSGFIKSYKLVLVPLYNCHFPAESLSLPGMVCLDADTVDKETFIVLWSFLKKRFIYA